MAADEPHELSVEEVQQLAEDKAEFVLLDCRQPEEFAIVQLPKAVLIPMDELPQRIAELEAWKQSRIVVYCHHGIRSQMVANWLRGQGFPFVQNMTGGIEAWAIRIDTSLPRY